MMPKLRDFLILLVTSFCLLTFMPTIVQAAPRVLHFEGVPVAMAATIKKKFPFVFEREVTLAEVDEVVRFLMTTQMFSNIEVVEKNPGTPQEQLVLSAQILRRIKEISIKGNQALNEEQIRDILKIQKDQSFERKELLAAADELQSTYSKEGYFSPKIDIDFDTPSENEVNIKITVNEGPPCKIVDVIIETPNKALARRAKHMAGHLINQRLSEDAISTYQKDLNEYFSQHRYLATKLSSPAIVFNADKSRAKVTYLIDNPDRYEFVFDGNKYFSVGELIQSMELEKYYGITSSPAPDLTEKIRNLYLNAGFANVVVDYKEKSFDNLHKQQIHFIIHEDQRTRIAKIDISGNLSRPPKYYVHFIKDNSSDLILLGYYNHKDIETGYKNLLIDLQNQGFLKAKVQSVRTEYSRQKDFVTVYIAIDEGPLTQVRQIHFEGVNAFSNSQLLDVLLTKVNEPLSLKDLEESLTKLRDYYQSQGYLEMKILNEAAGLVTYNDTNTQADLDIQIQEGPKVLVSSINIQGNTFTHSDVILREIEIQPGDTLTPEKLEESVYRLQKLGLFAKVDITTLEEGTMIASRTLVISVVERDPGIFSSGIGLTNRYQITYRGYLGFAYRNLGGTGRAVSARLNLDYAADPRFSFLENKLTFGYLEPYLFDTRNRGRVNLTREQKVEDPTEGLPTIIQENLEADLLVERDITRHTRLTYTAWGFTNERRFYRTTRDTLDIANIAKTGPLFEIDYRDNAFDTTQGTYSRIDLQYADPLLGSSRDSTQTIQFAKASTSVTNFQRINNSPRFLWINSLRGGYITNVSGNSNASIPFSEIFSLGGSSTIRGFDVQKDTDRIPNIYELNPKRSDTYQIGDFRLTGSSEYFLIKSEVRIPLYAPFAFALFYDGGAVYISQRGADDSLCNVNITKCSVDIPDPYRDSWGFGLRVNTPVGPVSADIGFKLDRRSYYNNLTGGQDEEAPWAFHLSIGNF